MYCSYCKATIKETDLFCKDCGKQIYNVKKESEFSCPQCKNDVPADAIYCWNCSISLENENLETVQSLSPLPNEEKLQTKFRTLKANRKIIEEGVCKICSVHFTLGEDIYICENCHNYYHKKCWELNAGCNQYFCREENKSCPLCGQQIKKSALKCKHCGKYLDSSLGDKTVSKGELKDASTALTYAIIGIFCFGIILGPMAISKGNSAISQIDSDPGWEGRGKAQAAIIIGWIVVALWVIGILVRVLNN